MKRQSQVPAAMGVAVLLLLSAAAWAGARYSVGVTLTITGATGKATGTMGGARNSSDTVQYIGCEVEAEIITMSPGTIAYVYCSARNAAGTSVYCISDRPDFVSAAQAIASDSRIEFEWSDEGECTQLSVSNYSYDAVKAH